MAKKKLPCPKCNSLMSGKVRGIPVRREGIVFLTTPKVYKCKKCGHMHLTPKERKKVLTQVDKDYPEAMKIHQKKLKEKEKVELSGEEEK